MAYNLAAFFGPLAVRDRRGLAPVAAPAFEPVTLAEAKAHVRRTQPDDDALLAGLVAAARTYCENAANRAVVTQTWRLSLDRFPGWAGWTGPVGVNPVPGWGAWDAAVRLPLGRVQAVTSVTYLDQALARQTVDPAGYRLANDGEPARLEPAYGSFWPFAVCVAEAVQVTFVAGWPVTTVAAPIAAGTRTVTPADMTGIAAGTPLWVTAAGTDPAGLTDAEAVQVTATTATTFTAAFAKSHAAGAIANGVPAALRQAVLLVLGHWFENREAVVTGAVSGPLAHAVDALLRQYATGEYL